MIAITRSLVAVVALLGATAANALTLDSLQGQGLEPLFGDYAPGGDCTRTPRLTVDTSGFTFTTGVTTTHHPTLEYAVSYMGLDYAGETLVFFPFPVSEEEMGHLVMFMNADEHPGRVTFEDNLAPGEAYNSVEAQLVGAPPFERCQR